MTLDALLIGYLSFTFILAVTPGSTTAVVVRNALSRGRSAGFATAAGAALGNTSQAAAAGLGLAVLLARWPASALALKWGGAAYLAWLGVSSLWRVVRRADGGFPLPTGDSRDGFTLQQHGTSFRQGLTVNLLNPAITTFYLVVVPSFVPPGAARWYFAVLAAIHIVIAFACHGVWTLAFDRLRRFFHQPHARRMLEGATGIALLGLALRVATRG